MIYNNIEKRYVALAFRHTLYHPMGTFSTRRAKKAARRANKRATAARRAKIWVFLAFKLLGYIHTCAYVIHVLTQK